MNSAAVPVDRQKGWRQGIGERLSRVPLWAFLVLATTMLLAFSPNLLLVYGIHNDYESLLVKERGLWHAEALDLASLGRPVAALLSNLPLLPIESMADYRWSRLFSLVTLFVLGVQLMVICIHRLHVRVLDALAIALASFLVLPFIYSVLQASAWAPHLITILIAFVAYEILSRSNVHVLSFMGVSWRDARTVRGLSLQLRQAVAYASLRPVWLGSLVFQAALYDYPPNAFVLALLPVACILFGQAPRAYRYLIAVRDVAFIAINLVIFAVSTALIYLPIVRVFIFRNSEAWRSSDLNAFQVRTAPTYKFGLNGDPGEMLSRLKGLLSVSGDLWFLPQFSAHVLFGAVLAAAAAVAGARLIGTLKTGRGVAQGKATGRDMVVTPLVIIACFLMAASPVLASSGGIVTYRTVAIPTAIAAIVFLSAVRFLACTVWRALGNPFIAATKVADAAMVAALGLALASNYDANHSTMRLAGQEFAYFTDIVKQAVAKGARTIVLLEERPFSLPEDNPVLFDRSGRPIPPYELGCMSSYCLQTGAIAQIASEELGYRRREFTVIPMRPDDPIPGFTCALLDTPARYFPPGASDNTIDHLRHLRRLKPVLCTKLGLDWQDLSPGP